MSNYIWGNNETQFFTNLSPEIILDSVDALGLRTTGRCLTMNSMENRVYELEIEVENPISASDNFVIAKFYRPGRWSREQILEEHEFLLDLEEQEIPAIAPLKFNGETLFKCSITGLYYCLFPKRGGRAPDEMTEVQLQMMGRLLARIHNVGATKKAQNRVQITPETFGEQNLKFLLENKIIPHYQEPAYKETVEQIVKLSKPLFEKRSVHRIHGDCHWGNILLRDESLYFIDFDDMLTGPAVQDVWLIIPGTDERSRIDRDIMLEAYDSMRSFDYSSLKLIEPLRALRFIHFAAWIAKRWDDPAFQRAFPQFKEHNYWDGQIADLKTQLMSISSL